MNGDLNQSDVLHKLDMLICLMAHQASSSIDSVEQKAIFLRSIGMQPIEKGKVLGTQASSIRATLARAKKKPKKRNKVTN